MSEVCNYNFLIDCFLYLSTGQVLTISNVVRLLIIYLEEKLSTRVSKASKKKAFVVLDRIADGCNSSGFTWHLKVPNVSGIGLRGTTFLSLNSDGEIDYVREVVEPLYKPGSAIVGTFKTIHTV